MKNPDAVKKFGTHFRRVREEHEMSQQKLADIANLSKMTIQRVENGKQAVTIDVLISICTALEITIQEFFGDFEL